MTSFFNSLGNPFSTQVGQKIEEATDCSQPSENWALILEVCDFINGSDDGPKDAIRAIRRRLQQNVGKNYKTVLYTLTLLEACVKNCDRRFHVLVCSKDFVQDLIKLIEPKNDPPVVVQEKILSLIQSWADAFHAHPDMSAVVRMYNDLKMKGIEFPMTDLDAMAPIHTPRKTASDSETPRQTKPRPVASGDLQLTRPDVADVNTEYNLRLSPEQMAKLRSELDIVQENMTILNEMLTEMVPGQEHPSDLELLITMIYFETLQSKMSLKAAILNLLQTHTQFIELWSGCVRTMLQCQLYNTCKAMQNRLVELISQLANDEVTAELLRINDLLNNLFLRYSRYEKNRSAKVQPQGSSDQAVSLIDLRPDDDNVKTETLVNDFKTMSLKKPDVTKPAGKPDSDFDMFAQSRTASYENSKKSGSTYEDNLRSDQLKSGIASVALSRSQPPSLDPDIIGMHRESDFDEMAAWLEEQGATEPDSLTSSEFDRFLAERAAAAENLPTESSATSSTGSNANRTTPSQRNKYAIKDPYAHQ